MRKGFTLVELMLVMGIMAVLFGIMAIGYFGVQGRSLLTQGSDILVADLRSQQAKAMTGTLSGGAEQAGYGIHFETSTYTLFPGTSYVPGAAANSVVNLPAGITVSDAAFPGDTVVFLRASGEIQGFTAGQDYIELSGAGSGTSRRIRLNQLGVITEGI